MLSAVSMAWRTMSSTATKSTTEPAFMPLAAVWAKPRMRTPWLRRSNTSCGACGSSRAIRQAILLVPISRPATIAARRGETGFILGVRPKRSTVMRRLPRPSFRDSPKGWARNPDASSAQSSGFRVRCFAAPQNDRKEIAQAASCLAALFLLLALFGGLERGVASRRGDIGLADRDAVGQPQIDGGDIARQQLLVAIEIDQSAQRLLGLAFRQQHLDAVFKMQVPAPFGDQHRGFDRLRDRRIALEQPEEILRLMLGAATDHQRQRGETLRHEGFQHGAVGGDQINAAFLLPERESLAFLDLDAQPVGIKLEYGGVRDPRIC